MWRPPSDNNHVQPEATASTAPGAMCSANHQQGVHVPRSWSTLEPKFRDGGGVASPPEATAGFRLQILGEPSAASPAQSNPTVVDGPFRDLDGLAQNVLRFMNPVNVTAGSGKISPTKEQDEPISASTQSIITKKERPNRRKPTGHRKTTSANAHRKKPCPWPGRCGTSASNLSKTHRLKYIRKSDKHQIMDHLHRKHRAPKDQYKVLTPETLKGAQMRALGERGISRERIVEICNAKHVDDLNGRTG
ncbi:hypothetical protein FN846DRAFT_892293 [Sphaerosporella brunnea]|uniref:Uncharacterized protein n=1 Tax=Sphaerosporella brunnea TaxID=1250544 RepID=A0A5J5EQL7_9PEZI|nr:hypothetical protein FN846DRAFT_892293 [Sphaerosporella brunnea]